MGLLQDNDKQNFKPLGDCLAFEQCIKQAISSSGLNLQKINLQYSEVHDGWEWIGYVAPNLSDWVSIWKDADIWHVSAITDMCGVLKLVHSDLSAALSELKLVSHTQRA